MQVPVNEKEKECDRWPGNRAAWGYVENIIMKTEKDYCHEVMDHRDDVTMREVKKEFWNRLAEFYGFTINWPKE